MDKAEKKLAFRSAQALVTVTLYGEVKFPTPLSQE
jgi:hypothetical protein